jgi:hypothetical protein
VPTNITETSVLISHAKWRKETSAGLLGIRSKELEAIDRHLLRFERATSAYGKEWEANEVRIAFDNYVKNHPDWKTSDRNKTKALEKLDADLAFLGLARPLPVNQDAGIATNLRQGTLYFVAHLKSDLVPADWGTFLNDSLDQASDLHDAVRTAQSKGGVKNTASALAGSVKAGAKGDNAADGFLKSLIGALREYLRDLAGSVNDVLQNALQAIAHALPELVSKLLGAVVQNLGAAVEIAKNLVKAGKAAVATFSSRHLEEGVLSGHPRTVVAAVRDQIKDSGLDGLSDAVKTALVTGIGALNPIAGTVVAAIAAVYKFIAEIWQRIKARAKLAALIVKAREHYATRLYADAAGFSKWFLEAIKDLPLLSCYCMRMPMTGSYYGFLTMVATDGSQLRYDQLERNYGEFNDVRTWAEKFIKHGTINLTSDDGLVAHSLKVAKGETRSELKKTLASRVKKITFTMVEQAAA